jgi:uncharacterized damage-inducible protein DinB
MKLLAMLALAALAAPAQDQISKDAKMLFGITANHLAKSADKVPEEIFAFKPSADVRTFGEILAHVADAQYMFCSAAKAEENPKKGTSLEKTVKTKSDIGAALKEATAYCQAAYDSLDDKKAGEMVKFGRGERSRLGVLMFNFMHNYEHYGNIVTYMRIKGIVPPSSEGR